MTKLSFMPAVKPVLMGLCLALTAQGSVQAQDRQEVQIGKPMPEHTFKNIYYHKKKEISLKDMKGKWMVLDFWNLGCKPCIASFPKVNKLQAHFGDKIQFLLVGDNAAYLGLPDPKATFDRLKAKQGLDLPVVFDSTVFDRFDIGSVPHIIVIDDKGIVRAIADGVSINEENLQTFLDGGDPKIALKAGNLPPELVTPVDLDKPFLMNGNAGKDSVFLYRSVLSQWNRSMPQLVTPVEYFDGKGYYQVTGTMLGWLYNTAYFGKDAWHSTDTMYGRYWKEPILEISHPEDFKDDFLTGKNIYNYSTIFPKEKHSKAFLMKTVQRDLDYYFDYDASVETRPMPILRLIITDPKKAAKLRTKTKPGADLCVGSTGDVTGYSLVNYTMPYLVQAISSFFPFDPPYVDETGIDYNVDIVLDAYMLSKEEVLKELRRNGLDLVKGERPMKVIVIRDRQQ